MIVLPLILGIGVDTGVQIVHDYLREPHPYRMNPSTSAALVINTLMNIVGFGALMIASHRGLHSLGRVLTLGMACCLLSCMVMPSLLQHSPRHAAEAAAAEAAPPEDARCRDRSRGQARRVADTCPRDPPKSRVRNGSFVGRIGKPSYTKLIRFAQFRATFRRKNFLVK